MRTVFPKANRANAAAVIATTLIAASVTAEAEYQTPITIGVAGVPRSLGATRDYDRIFSILRAHDIELFFPIFLYEEAPASLSLGHETDFAPPCQPDDPAFVALRAHDIGLIVPVSLLYDASAPLPPLDRDPLAALIACAGRDTIFGVTSFDEPAHNGVPLSATKALYGRIKAVAPDMPVLMVHAPLRIDPAGQDSEAERLDYLASVEEQSAYADIVGFDTYPVPPSIAKIGAPGRADAIVDATTAVGDYLRFIERVAPGRQYLSVLQNFSYRDQFSPELLAQFSAELRELARAPTKDEMQDMALEAVAGGARVLIWYGGAYMDSDDAAEWKAMLDVSAGLRGPD